MHRNSQIWPFVIKFMSQGLNELNNGVLTKLFSSRAVAQILDFFLDHKEFDYPPSEIAKKTGLSFRTIFREMPGLERNQLIFNNRRIGKTNMYKLNTDFEAVALLEICFGNIPICVPTKNNWMLKIQWNYYI